MYVSVQVDFATPISSANVWYSYVSRLASSAFTSCAASQMSWRNRAKVFFATRFPSNCWLNFSQAHRVTVKTPDIPSRCFHCNSTIARPYYVLRVTKAHGAMRKWSILRAAQAELRFLSPVIAYQQSVDYSALSFFRSLHP